MTLTFPRLQRLRYLVDAMAVVWILGKSSIGEWGSCQLDAGDVVQTEESVSTFRSRKTMRGRVIGEYKPRIRMLCFLWIRRTDAALDVYWRWQNFYFFSHLNKGHFTLFKGSVKALWKQHVLRLCMVFPNIMGQAGKMRSKKSVLQEASKCHMYLRTKNHFFLQFFFHGEPGLRLQLGVVFIEIVQIGPSVDGDVLDMS